MKKILVIDDSMITRKHLSKFLGEQGYAVSSANSGEEGLSMMENETFDCLILDQLMPGLEGAQVLNQLRSLGNQVPVIMLTADTQTTTRNNLLGAGASDVLPKPPNMPGLQQMIERLTS